MAQGGITKQEIAFFVNIDFVNHVALVAALSEGGVTTIIGGGRYILARPGTAEVAFAVVDEFQGQGIGAALMRHLTAIARDAGLKELIAEVLAENSPMLKVFEKTGLPCKMTRESGVVHISRSNCGDTNNLPDVDYRPLPPRRQKLPLRVQSMWTDAVRWQGNRVLRAGAGHAERAG